MVEPKKLDEPLNLSAMEIGKKLSQILDEICNLDKNDPNYRKKVELWLNDAYGIAYTQGFMFQFEAMKAVGLRYWVTDDGLTIQVKKTI